MKVKYLIEELERCQKIYPDFLAWKVYTEQVTEDDKEAKTNGIQSNWGKIKDSEDFEYFECAGFWTKFEKEKIFTVNVNY